MRSVKAGVLFCCALASRAEWPQPIQLGPVKLTPSGFVEAIEAYRSRTTNDGVATRFGSIPLRDTPNEWAFSFRHSRVMLRGEVPVGPGMFEGYLEADFLNRSAPHDYRWRQYFGQYSIAGWEFSGGQEWSLLRPNRVGMSSEISLMNTYVAEPSYHVGLLGFRNRQIRIVRHFGAWHAGASYEDGRDFLPKLAHDGKRIHWEIAGVAGRGRHRGLTIDAVLQVSKKIKVVNQEFWSQGGGKDALSTVPQGVKTYAALVGPELEVTPRVRLFGYAGIVYGGRSSGNRTVGEWTVGGSRELFRDVLGSGIGIAQFSVLDRATWTGASGRMSMAMISFRQYFGLRR